MSELIVQPANLPDNIEDLSRFVLIGREKLNAVKAEIRAIEKLHIAQDVRNQKRAEASMISEAVLDAEVKLGELFSNIKPKQGGDRKSENFKLRTAAEFENNTDKTKTEIIEDLGFSPDQANRFETLADNADIVEYVKAEARENDNYPTRGRVLELAAYQKKQTSELDDYAFIDLCAKVYKDFMKIIDLTARFEITDVNMNALRNNFDSVLTVEDHIDYVNDSINKLNLIKTEIWRAKKHEKNYR
jgi:hypothetical protein